MSISKRMLRIEDFGAVCERYAPDWAESVAESIECYLSATRYRQLLDALVDTQAERDWADCSDWIVKKMEDEAESVAVDRYLDSREDGP